MRTIEMIKHDLTSTTTARCPRRLHILFDFLRLCIIIHSTTMFMWRLFKKRDREHLKSKE
ncbi:MAG: hypothetical protein Kow0021_01670 [Methanothermobacter thermautotrophicus]